jgi:peptide/nickel transport system permease protein
MNAQTLASAPSTAAEALVAQPALVKRKRGWPTPGAIIGMLWLGALAFSSVFADQLPFIRHYSQEVIVNGEVANRYALGPGWDAWFGTDSLGRDVFAKCIYGARTTLFIGVIATAIGLVFGGLTGIIAGYRRGKTDRIFGIFTDALLAMPALLLAVIMIYKLDAIKEDQTWLGWADRRWQITIALGLVAIGPLSRIVRAQTLSLREREFVLAARSIGARTGRVLGREILPNLIPAMLTVAFTGLALLIAAEGGLAFLGLSVEVPTPTWGRLINANYDALDRGWWATVFPCLMLLMTVLSFNMIGDWLARRFDIREATV